MIIKLLLLVLQLMMMMKLLMNSLFQSLLMFIKSYLNLSKLFLADCLLEDLFLLSLLLLPLLQILKLLLLLWLQLRKDSRALVCKSTKIVRGAAWRIMVQMFRRHNRRSCHVIVVLRYVLRSAIRPICRSTSGLAQGFEQR